MSDSDETRDPVEELAEEFLDRHRRGESPSVSEYAEAHPAWAEQIRDLFPALLVLEGIKSDPCDSTVAGDVPLGVEQPPGRLGDFQIIRELGRGGMGVVYEAEQVSLGRRVALKVLRASYSSSRRALRRFRREAQAAARLHHTNIVSIFGVGESDGVHFFVMQYIEGASLDRVLVELARNQSERSRETAPIAAGLADHENGTEGSASIAVARHLLAGRFEPTPLRKTDIAKAESLGSGTETDTILDSPEESAGDHEHRRLPESTSSGSLLNSKSFGLRYWRSVAAIGVKAAEALHHAHKQGTLHRDIKPANLLLDVEQNVWITDFGLAKLADLDDLTQPGDVVGTLRYMAPEQLDGTTDNRSDVFSLGLTLYELLTLRPAFDATSRQGLVRQVSQQDPLPLRAMNSDIPKDLETIVLKAIARDPSHRYQTADELADDLQRYLEDLPIHARRTSSLEHAWRWCRRNPAIASLAGTALLLLVALAAGASTGYVKRTQALQRESELLTRARQERGRAEANLQLAAEAFDEVFSKLSGAPSAPVGSETDDGLWYSGPTVVSPENVPVLDSLLEFYDRFAQRNRDSEHWQRETALAFRRIGDIHRLLDEHDEARSAYLRAIKLYEQLRQTAPQQPEYVIGLAAIHNELALVNEKTRNFDEGLRETQQALQLLKDSQHLVDGLASARFELARSYEQMGFLAIVRRFGPRRFKGKHEVEDDALERTQQALALYLDLASEDPDNGAYRFAVARCYRHSAFAGQSTRSQEHATWLAQAEQAIQTMEQLVERFPDAPQYRAELAFTYAITAFAQAQAADATRLEVLVDRLQRGMTLAEDLIASYPDVPHYRGTLVACNIGLANCRWVAGNREEAVQPAMRAIEESRSLCEQSPNVEPWKGMYNRSLHAAVCVHYLQGNPAQVRPLLEELIELASQRLDRESDPPHVPGVLPDAYALLATVLTELNEPELAEQASRKTAELRPLVAERPERPRFGPLDADLDRLLPP